MVECMVKEFSPNRMDIDMRVVGLTIKCKDQVENLGQMGLYMKEVLFRVRKMGKEDFKWLMEMFTTVTSKKMECMVMVD